VKQIAFIRRIIAKILGILPARSRKYRQLGIEVAGMRIFSTSAHYLALILKAQWLL